MQLNPFSDFQEHCSDQHEMSVKIFQTIYLFTIFHIYIYKVLIELTRIFYSDLTVALYRYKKEN